MKWSLILVFVPPLMGRGRCPKGERLRFVVFVSVPCGSQEQETNASQTKTQVHSSYNNPDAAIATLLNGRLNPICATLARLSPIALPALRNGEPLLSFTTGSLLSSTMMSSPSTTRPTMRFVSSSSADGATVMVNSVPFGIMPDFSTTFTSFPCCATSLVFSTLHANT